MHSTLVIRCFELPRLHCSSGSIGIDCIEVAIDANGQLLKRLECSDLFSSWLLPLSLHSIERLHCWPHSDSELALLHYLPLKMEK